MSWPEKIRMGGLPMNLMCLEQSIWGWNTEFKQTEDTNEGAPVYRFEDYWLGPIEICGCTIEKSNGKWVLHRNTDNELEVLLDKDGEDQETPLGDWSAGTSYPIVSNPPHGVVFDPKSSWVYGWF